MTELAASERDAGVRGKLLAVRSRHLDAARVAALLILLGVAIRVIGFVSNRSLWLDEAMLGLNILDRSFAGLLRPLDYNQGAPVGFLLLVKAVTVLWGEHEYALRLVPLIAGLASLPLFYLVARRCLKENEALVALGFFVILEPLIYYSSELKQYGVDVAFTLAILLSGLIVLQDSRFRPGGYVRLAVVGAVAVWFSHPCVFVLAGVCVALCLTARSNASRAAALAAAVPGGACFLAHYLLFMRNLGANEKLMASWEERFLQLPLSPGALRQDARLVLDLFEFPLGFSEIGLAVLAFVAGVSLLGRRDLRVSGLLAGPVILLLVASLLHKYPFASRPLLFVVPVLLLFIAVGVAYLLEVTRRDARIVGYAFLLLLVLKPAVGAAKALVSPPGKQEMKDVLRYVSRRSEPGDAIYVYYNSRFAFAYYVDHLGFRQLAGHRRIVGPHVTDETTRLEDQLALYRGERVWFIFSHIERYKDADHRLLLLGELDRLGKQEDAYETVGAWAHLYRLNP